MTDEAPIDGGQAPAAPTDAGQAPEPVSWYDSADDETKGYIQNKGWDDPLKAITSYKELEKFQGTSPDRLIKLPKEGDPMDEVYNKLGRPETPDQYKWDAPDNVNMDEKRFSKYRQAAHEGGVSQEAFEKLANADAEYWAEAQEEHFKQIEAQQTAELNKLQSEWGEAFDERAELGRRFVAKNLPDDMDKGATLNAIEEAIGTAAMLKLFANAGDRSSVREDRLPDSGSDRPFGYTREQATADKRELMQSIQADPERLNQYNSGKGNDFDKLRKLNEIIAG